jgi:hypothetical protein
MPSCGRALVVACWWVGAASAQPAGEKQAAVRYLRGLQTKGGGFLAAKPAGTDRRRLAPGLRATTAALRALHHFGGEASDPKGAARFVQGCFDPSAGGFAEAPGRGPPDVIATAVGLMAVAELKLSARRYVIRAVPFLDAHAKTFEEVRMAAAGLEAVRRRPAKAEDWRRQVARLRNADGTYGRGDGVARITASAVVTVLSLGGAVGRRDRVVAALRAGQRKDGGFGKEGAHGSDLETCYRVTRAFVMLKEKPARVPALRRFVSRCRNADGGYGVAPGRPSSVPATYFAASVLHWLRAM